MELKKILCAVDLKDSVNPAVEYAKMLSELSGASISAIYVVSSRSAYENLQVPVEDIAKGMRSIWSRARGDMDAFVEKQFPGMDVNGLIYEGRPAEKIVEIAKELGVDMIVMGTHAREGLDRLFFGSVANLVNDHTAKYSRQQEARVGTSKGIVIKRGSGKVLSFSFRRVRGHGTGQRRRRERLHGHEAVSVSGLGAMALRMVRMCLGDDVSEPRLAHGFLYNSK